MAIAWLDSMTTGFPEIDDQHKELIARVNALADAVSSGRGREVILPMLSFLGNYVVEHFGFEESCMARYRCPVAAENKAAHAKFIEDFSAIVARFAQEGASDKLVVQIEQKISNWLVTHICRIDTALNCCRTAA